MPGFLTDYANNKLLDVVFGGTAFSPPATLHVGLSKLPAAKTGAVSEPSGGGYARVAVSNVVAQFPASVGGTKTNAATVTFPAPTVDWGTIQSIFLADAASGGNVIAIADLPTPKPISAGNPAPSITPGALFISHT